MIRYMMSVNELNETIINFKKYGYTTSLYQTAELATQYLAKVIYEKTIGFGDSHTLHEIGLYHALSIHNDVHDPIQAKNEQEFIEIAKKCLLADVYICSANAASQSGELVNIDGTGNRIAGSLFGHQKVYFVIGVNKIMPTLDDAIWRARNIAAPRNAKRLGLKTPCAVYGKKCYDCSSHDRICNALIVHYRKPDHIDMEIIIINQELGL